MRAKSCPPFPGKEASSLMGVSGLFLWTVRGGVCDAECESALGHLTGSMDVRRQ